MHGRAAETSHGSTSRAAAPPVAAPIRQGVTTPVSAPKLQRVATPVAASVLQRVATPSDVGRLAGNRAGLRALARSATPVIDPRLGNRAAINALSAPHGATATLARCTGGCQCGGKCGGSKDDALTEAELRGSRR